VQSTHATDARTTGGSRLLRVRVAPGARRAEIVGRLGDAWKVRVRAAPERGHANDEVVALLAGALGLTTADVRLVAGHASRSKLVELRGISMEDAELRLSSGADAR